MTGSLPLTCRHSPAEAFSPTLRRVVAVVMIGATLPFLDSTIVNVALHSLSVGLHTPLTSVQRVVTGYLLALAAVIPVTAPTFWLIRAERTAGNAGLVPIRYHEGDLHDLHRR